MNYIENNKKQLNHCQCELTKQQDQTCAIQGLSCEQIQQRLQELVDRERKYLSKRSNDKLTKCKDNISEKQMTEISVSTLSNIIKKTTGCLEEMSNAASHENNIRESITEIYGNNRIKKI